MATEKNALVTILGLSDDPSRYAYKAAQRLQESGYLNVRGVHPSGESVAHVQVVKSISDIKEPIDTLTLYVNPLKLDTMFESILKAKPKRIIFNPGTEHPALMKSAKQKGIQVLEACTLVLLSIKQF
ncbi:MAG: CoA-binding protein [Proteobacteria bacterium]|nr:MAG: CoA-binding protein [Pseudomonadota bacterium]